MNKLNEVQLAFFFSKNSNFFDNSKLNNKLYLLFRNDFDVLPTSSMPPMNPAVPLFNWNCKKIMIEYNATRFDLRFRPEDGEDGFERAIDYIKRLASIFSETNLNIVNLGIIVSVLNDDAKNFIQKHAEMNDVFLLHLMMFIIQKIRMRRIRTYHLQVYRTLYLTL